VAWTVGSKVFFSEEKKQETFATSDPGAAWKVRDSIRKSLLVLFFRKEHFLAFAPAPPVFGGGGNALGLPGTYRWIAHGAGHH
jgi:hypothetical protein